MSETKNVYRVPVDMKIVEYTKSDGPGHSVPYDKAIDYAVLVGTEVFAPLGGEVIAVVDSHDEYGPDIKYAKKCNYVQIRHANGETSDLIHLDKGSVMVKVGEKVKQGQLIAKTGLSGYMTAPHLHWMVFRRANNKEGFESLENKIAPRGLHEGCKIEVG